MKAPAKQTAPGLAPAGGCLPQHPKPRRRSVARSGSAPAPAGCQIITVADPAALFDLVRQFAPTSTPIVLYACNLSNCIISTGGINAIADNGSLSVAGCGNTVAPAPDLAQLYKLVNRLINTVEDLNAKVEQLQKQITTQSN